MAYGWDGVGGRMMICFALRDVLNAQERIDTATWTFDGTRWTEAVAPPVATPRIWALLDFDSARHREVLVAWNSQVPETWEWDGVKWQQRSTPHLPKVYTQNTSDAYSPELGATVLLDTAIGAPPMNPSPQPTWLYDGTDWRPVVTKHTPGYFAQLEYDAKRHSIVALSTDDYRTWLFDGRDWTPLPLAGPTPRFATGAVGQGRSVALDQQREVWVVHGGFDGIDMLTDTWTGDGVSWTKQAPAVTPSPRTTIPGRNNLAWDPVGHRLLLFGGSARPEQGPDLGDTWAWDGANWSKLAG